MWHDDTDANQPFAGERTERDPAGVDVVLQHVDLGLDGVFAVTVRVPGRRVPVAVPRDELGAVLDVLHVDAFPTVDLADTATQLGPAQPLGTRLRVPPPHVGTRTFHVERPYGVVTGLPDEHAADTDGRARAPR